VTAVPAMWSEFKSDLWASLRAWRTAPLMPIISVALFMPSYIPEPWWWLGLPALLFAVGWFGSERMWYLRIYRNEAIAPQELWRITWAFFWRFLRLGILAAIVWSPVIILWYRNTSNDRNNADEAFSTPAVFVTSAVLTVVVDFGLTFVTPALTYSTKRVREALRLGLRMLRNYWPQTAWYALVPPLAAMMMFRLAAPPTLSTPWQIVFSAAGTLLNLWFKGATAAFYLRRVEVGNQGAAFVQEVETEGPAT
jgi:hypothetical protein